VVMFVSLALTIFQKLYRDGDDLRSQSETIIKPRPSASPDTPTANNIMAPFFPLYVLRSDGRLVISSKGSKEPNQPIASQLDSKPNAQGISDFYRECPPGDPKEIDWRRKLGGMLMRELGGAETKGIFHRNNKDQVP